MKKQLKLKSGITLIALVITIIILIILAAVSISILSGENGIINKAQQSKEKQESATYGDRIQLAIQNTFLETQSNNIDTYIADIKKDEMLKDAKIDKEDDTTAYITIENKYVYTLQIAGGEQINFEYIGMAGKLMPKVVSLSTADAKSDSITVNVEALRATSYKYYIKNATTGEYDYKGENNTGVFEYTDLAQGVTQELKVVAINENGEDYKTITEVTRIIPTLTITGSPTTDATGWYLEDVVVKITAGTDANSGVSKITYTLTGATTQAETEIANNGTITISNNGTTIITAYTYDGANNKSEATITINKDAETPNYSNVSGQSVSKASHTHVSSCNGTCGGTCTLAYWNGDIGRDYCHVQMQCNRCGYSFWYDYPSYNFSDWYYSGATMSCTRTVAKCGKSPVTATVTLQKTTNLERTKAKVIISNGTINSVTWSGDYTSLSDTEVIVNSGTVSCSVSYTAGTSSSTGTTSGSATFSVTK